jgi:hypothetical protein
MSFNKLLLSLFILPLSVTLACFDGKKKDDDNSGAVSDLATSSVGTVSEVMEAVDDSSSSGTAYLPKIMKEDTLVAKIGDIFRGSAAYAASPYIDVYRTISPNSWSDSGATWIWNYRIFNSYPLSSRVIVTGAGLHKWHNLGAGTNDAKITTNTQFDQAPINKIFTNTRTGRYMTVVGNGSPLDSTGISLYQQGTGNLWTGTAPQGNIAHTVKWTAADTFTIDINLTRSGYDSNGNNLFIHTVTTPTVLTVVNTASNRTINGEIDVLHARVGLTIKFTFKDVVYDLTSKTITSGTITIVSSGKFGGSGTVTFNNDGTASVAFEGHTVAIDM